MLPSYGLVEGEDDMVKLIQIGSCFPFFWNDTFLPREHKPNDFMQHTTVFHF